MTQDKGRDAETQAIQRKQRRPAIRFRVDPGQIRFCFQVRGKRERLRTLRHSVGLDRRLRRGDWDRDVFPFREHDTYRLLATLLTSDFDPDCAFEPLVFYYQRRGQPAPRDKAEYKLHAYLAEYSQLARNMREKGYQAGLARDEIGVAIGRGGDLIKTSGGNHRLALAQLLALPEVVAEVRFSHVDRLPKGPRWGGRVDEGIRNDLVTSGYQLVTDS